MQAGQKVTVTNKFHAYRGQVGTITDTTTDEFGDIVFVQFADGKNIMVEATDVTLNKKGK
jgi:hypothetical protein